MFKNSNRGISTLVAIGIIAVLVVVVGGGVLGYQYISSQKNDNQQNNQNQNQQQTPPNNQVNDKQPSITVLSPNGGETWTAGSTHDITWTSTNLDSNTNVNIAFISGGTSVSIATVLNSGVYSWTLPFGNGATGLKISITSALNTSVSDNSDGIFTVAGNKQTAVWKTYTNTQYGFEIQYPDNMSIQNSTNGVSLVSADNQRKIDIKVESIEPGQDCRKTVWAADTPNKTIDNTVFVGVGSGLKDEPYYGVMYCTIRNGFDYMITSHLFHVSGGPNNFPEDDVVLNQILSTFKFKK